MGANALTPALTAQISAQWQTSHPGTTVEHLAVATPSHLSAESLGFRMPAGDAALTATQMAENAISEQLVL